MHCICFQLLVFFSQVCVLSLQWYSLTHACQFLHIWVQTRLILGHIQFNVMLTKKKDESGQWKISYNRRSYILISQNKLPSWPSTCSFNGPCLVNILLIVISEIFCYEWDKGRVGSRIFKLDTLKETTLTEYSIKPVPRPSLSVFSTALKLSKINFECLLWIKILSRFHSIWDSFN